MGISDTSKGAACEDSGDDGRRSMDQRSNLWNQGRGAKVSVGDNDSGESGYAPAATAAATAAKADNEGEPIEAIESESESPMEMRWRLKRFFKTPYLCGIIWLGPSSGVPIDSESSESESRWVPIER